jgi:hypothetical protein
MFTRIILASRPGEIPNRFLIRLYCSALPSLMLVNTGSGSVAMWEMNGDQISQSSLIANPSPNWHVVSAGRGSDILFQNPNGQVSIWDMDGIHLVGGSSRQRRSRVELTSGRTNLAIAQFCEANHVYAEPETGQIAVCPRHPHVTSRPYWICYNARDCGFVRFLPAYWDGG